MYLDMLDFTNHPPTTALNVLGMDGQRVCMNQNRKHAYVYPKYVQVCLLHSSICTFHYISQTAISNLVISSSIASTILINSHCGLSTEEHHCISSLPSSHQQEIIISFHRRGHRGVCGGLRRTVSPLVPLAPKAMLLTSS